MEPRFIRVIIADDHPVVRDGLLTIQAGHHQIQIVGVATSFEQVLDLLATIPADVLILDCRGMGGAPLTAVSRIRREYPQVGIVIFSSVVDLAPELLQAGVRGYVVKEELPSQLIAAICAIHAGQCFLSPIVEEYVQHATSQRVQHRLTQQELTVVTLLAEGLGTPDIAAHLGINERTVQYHITNALQKTGCQRRPQLIHWYLQIYGERMA
jgi:DNA-binding NarL/FixJ family response regulator